MGGVGSPLYRASTFSRFSLQKQRNTSNPFAISGQYRIDKTAPRGVIRRGEGERVVTSPLPTPEVDVWGDRNGACHERLTLPTSSWNPVESNDNCTDTTNAATGTHVHPRYSRSRPASSGDTGDTDSSNNHERTTPSFAMQWNICGLRSHRSELQMLVAKHQPIVISLQETNIGNRQLSTKFLGNSYDFLFSHCSSHGRQGAGLAIKNGTPFQRIQVQTNLQVVAIQLFVPMKITVASVYLPPRDKDAVSLLEDLLKELPKPTLLLGDLNAHHVAWGSKIGSSITEDKIKGEKILELVIENDMVVLNDGSHTRIDPAT